jgi:arylformamidase
LAPPAFPAALDESIDMTSLHKKTAACGALLVLLCAQAAFAGPLRDRLLQRRAQQQQNETLEDGAEDGIAATLPAKVRLVRDIAYGSDAHQRFDVYRPAQATAVASPVIFLVHGGGWRRGDKAMRSVVENKVARWVPQGFVVISTNYRLLPGTDPLQQAADVARALATAQQQAASWGADGKRFIVMGHSAGAHLVALLASAPDIAARAGAAPWLGTVALDSAAFDVTQIMQARHMRLYDQAFGSDPAYWDKVSPYHALTRAGAPLLAVCSSRRDDSCAQASRYVARATQLGMRASVLQEDMSHKEINERLGEEPGYTQAVEAFLRNLDARVATTLAAPRR